MAKKHRPRKGSLQFWPRRKAKKEAPTVKSWPSSKNVSLLGFVGYKAGMSHAYLKDNRAHSLTKGETIVWPVTIIECPPIKILSLRAYHKGAYGSRIVKELFNPKTNKELQKSLKITKKKDFEKEIKELEEKAGEFSDIRVNVYTQPKKTGFGKKKPEIFEVAIGGNDTKAKIDYIKGLLDKEIRAQDILKNGTRVDVHSVSQGKGFQGTVKRFGVGLRSHKSEKKRRGNVIAVETPGTVRWGAIMPGRMGYNTRTEYNKDLISIGDKPEQVNPKGGFLHYGLIKNDYVVLKGSVPGPAKRLIRLIEPIRGQKALGNIELQSVSVTSKQ